jgi:phage tail-like protein
MAQEVELRLRIEGPEPKKEGPIPRGKLTIGRGISNKVNLKHQQVSRRHAELEYTGVEAWLTDLASTVGTFVNGQKLEPHVPTLLEDGNIIEIGPYKLTFNPQAEKQPEIEENEGISSQGGGSPPASSPPVTALAPLPPPQFPQLSAYGLSLYGWRLLQYLPEIYHPSTFNEVDEVRYPSPVTFIPRFLGVFEAILTPIEWNVDNFDLFLNPGTAPVDFLPWLAGWFQIVFEPSWGEAKRRTFLKEAHWLFAWRGTKKALSRVLEIYTGVLPEIEEFETDELPDAYTFNVIIRPLQGQPVDPQIVERLIEANKPAHTIHKLRIVA